jgi:hypothetical protein
LGQTFRADSGNTDLMSGVTVERDRTFPAALLRKKVCSQSDMFRKIFHPKGLTVDMFYQVVRKDCFGSRGDAKQFFLVKVFRRLSFLQTKNVQRKNHERCFLRVVDMDIYMCIHIYIVLHDTFTVR